MLRDCGASNKGGMWNTANTTADKEKRLTGCGGGRRLVGCSAWSSRLTTRRGGGSTMGARYSAMGLRVRTTVSVRVRLREGMKWLVEHVRRITLSPLLEAASTHRPAQAARHRAATNNGPNTFNRFVTLFSTSLTDVDQHYGLLSIRMPLYESAYLNAWRYFDGTDCWTNLNVTLFSTSPTYTYKFALWTCT